MDDLFFLGSFCVSDSKKINLEKIILVVVVWIEICI